MQISEVGVYYRKSRKGGNRIWWLSYTVGGRQIFESSHGTSKRFAEKLLAIRKAEIAEGRYNLPSSNPPRIKDWTTDFLATVHHASTKSRYECSIKQILSFFGEKIRLTDLSVARIEAFKKKRLAGVIPLTESCLASLYRWRALTGPEFSSFVFHNPSNPSKPLLSIRKTWSTALRNAGLPPFPIYSLRATFASRLSAAGVPDGFVSQMLGHAGGLIQTYSKAVDEYRRDAIRKLGELKKTPTSRPTSAEPTPTIHPN